MILLQKGSPRWASRVGWASTIVSLPTDPPLGAYTNIRGGRMAHCQRFAATIRRRNACKARATRGMVSDPSETRRKMGGRKISGSSDLTSTESIVHLTNPSLPHQRRARGSPPFLERSRVLQEVWTPDHRSPDHLPSPGTPLSRSFVLLVLHDELLEH